MNEVVGKREKYSIKVNKISLEDELATLCYIID